jgi:DNA-binding transcriptional LysR family regulator
MSAAMELRHLRYFLAVGEASSFTRAAAQLRLAQPALSRQIQDLETDIGVILLKRSPRGVKLTTEGKFFLGEVRELLKHADESVNKVRGLARGHYGELHVGYASSFTVELIPPAVAAFEKRFPQVNLVLHDVSRAELIDGLERGALELGVIPVDAPIAGKHLETLRSYPFCAALPPGHRLARLKAIPLEKVAAQPLVGLRRKDYPGYYQALDRIFLRIGCKYRVAVECDTANSLITAIEAGRGIALSISAFKHVSGNRLIYRPLADVSEVYSIGIAREANADVTPASERFCDLLRKTAKGSHNAEPIRR